MDRRLHRRVAGGRGTTPESARVVAWARRHARTLVANFVIGGAFLPVLTIAPLSPSTLTGNAYYSFTNTGAVGIPWNASSLEPQLKNATLQGTPSVINGAGLTAIVALNAAGNIIVDEQTATGTTLFNATTALGLPAAAASPVCFFDPWHNVDVAYVSTTGALVLVTPTTDWQPHHEHARSANPFTITVVPSPTGATYAAGTPSALVQAGAGALVLTDSNGDAELVSLTWPTSNVDPVAGAPVNITTLTGAAPDLGEPVLIPGSGSPTLVASIVSGGNIVVFNEAATHVWSTLNVTTTAAAPTVVPPLEAAANDTTTYLSALSPAGDVDLFSATAGSELGAYKLPHIIGQPSSAWSYVDATTTSNAPPLAGTIALTATNASVQVAGEAANWGDLFLLSDTLPSSAWASTDLSVESSNANITVSPTVTAATVDEQPTFFTFDTGYTSPQGVGVYAIPQAKWPQAVTDGWPILADTGGLGATQAPWVQYVTSGGVGQSPDVGLGQAIANGHKGETWLSFWTVSGPLTTATQSVKSYYNHGYLAGAWVATQVDLYKSVGLNLVPNWLILDPEGYPDNHSFLDAPPGSSSSVFATYASYWAAMVSGWVAGIDSVNPALHAGLYAAQSEYRNYNLSTLPIPVFEALAFGGGGPTPISGGQGPNIRGYIAFDASCTPTATLKAEEAALVSAPWSGDINTLQFPAGAYCKP